MGVYRAPSYITQLHLSVKYWKIDIFNDTIELTFTNAVLIIYILGREEGSWVRL